MDILIIRFSSLGDIVMTTGVIEALIQTFPEARLHFLTKPQYAGLFSDDSRLTAIYGADGNPLDIKRMMGKNDGFDIVVDLHATLRSRAVSMLIGSKRTLRIHKHSLGRRLMVGTRNRYRRTFDTLGSYLAALSPLGVKGRHLPHLAVTQSSLEKVSPVFAGLPGEPVGFAPGARHAAKRWNEESFAEVADAVSDLGYTPVFLGDTSDVAAIERIRSLMRAESVSFAESFDIPGTVAAISLLRALVCNDSGPMHIAGALGIRFAAVFGPTHPDLGFVPGYTSGTVFHSEVACSPCSIHGEKPCRMERRFCMDDTTPEMILKYLALPRLR